MLGELIIESKGKITCRQVLSVENAVPKLELSVKRTGIFNGSIEVTETQETTIFICKKGGCTEQ